MRDIISLLFLLLFVIIRAAFCGYTTKTINESKGYTGGFWMGVLLAELGILIAVFKKELPDAPPNSYRVVSVVKVLKKFHYPFVSPQVEPIDILKGNIYAEGEAAKVNLVFWLIHGMFMLAWYSVILGAYLWYIIGYTIYWLFKYKLFKKGTAEDSVSSTVNAQSIKDSVVGGIGGLKERAGSTASKLSQKTEGIKTGAAEKATLAKEKAGAALAGVKRKASEFAAEHKKADNNASPSDGFNEETDITTTDVNVTEKALDTSISTSEAISKVSESASFDELYEKAMNTADAEENYDEAASLETDTEDAYNEKTVNEVKAPVAASVNPDSTPTITQQPAPSQYDNSEKKKTPVVFVLVGVIAVLLVGMGILGGMLLTKNKDDKGSDNSSDNEVIAATTKEKSAEANTASAQAVTSEITAQSQEIITTSEATTEASKGEKVDTSDAVKRALIAHLDKEFANEKSQEYYYFDRDVKYAVYDVNDDGIDELFISYHGIESVQTDLYIYKNGEYIKSLNFYNGVEICLNEHLVRSNGYGGGVATHIYAIINNEILQKDELLMLYDSAYYHNDLTITESEYNQLISQYDAMEWIYVPDNSIAVSDLIDMTQYVEKIGFTFFDSVDRVKKELLDYVLISEEDTISISDQNQHLIYYDYPAHGSIDIILGLCFVDNKLIGINFGFESTLHTPSEIFNNIRDNISAEYGAPDSLDTEILNWYVIMYPRN